MSLEIIKDQIFYFLSSDEPEVMAIKGEWGVGKTFSWDKYLKEAKEANLIKLDSYSYVSLFGINSLQELKLAIFENKVAGSLIGSEPSLETFRDNVFDVAKKYTKKGYSLGKEFKFFKSLAPAIETFSFLSLSKTIICIDDLERKGDKLDIKDILGLVSLLKEQKNCKVVLLLNDKKDEKGCYATYREKVVDIELLFHPTPDECALTAYPEEMKHTPKLKELVTKLNIRNIRVLKKIERLLGLAMPLLDEFEPELKDQVVHSIVILSWCHYYSGDNDDIPSVDFVIGQDGKRFPFEGDDGDVGDEEKGRRRRWREVLQDYEYLFSDELDKIVAKAVVAGYFVNGELIDEARVKNKQFLAAKSKGSFEKALRLFSDSFDDNEEHVIAEIYNGFMRNVKHVYPADLNYAVVTLRALDEPVKASEIIDEYVRSRKNEVELFNTVELRQFGDVRDAELISRFDEAYKALRKKQSLKVVLEKLAERKGWGVDDMDVLANATVDEYYEIFKSTTGRKLYSMVKRSLDFGKPINSSDEHKKVSNSATAALMRIGLESPINRARVKVHGVEIAEEAD